MGCGCCVHCVCTGRCVDGDQRSQARLGGVQHERSFASLHSNATSMPTSLNNSFAANTLPSPPPGGKDILSVISNLPHPNDQIYGRKSSRLPQPQSPAALTPRVGPVHHASSELERSASGVSLLRSALTMPLPGSLPHSRNPSRKVPYVPETTETTNRPARTRSGSRRDVDSHPSTEADRKLSVDTRTSSRNTSRGTSRQTSPDRDMAAAMPAKSRNPSRKARSSSKPPVVDEKSSDEGQSAPTTLRRKASRSSSSAHARKPSSGGDEISAIGGKAAKLSRSRSTKASRGPETTDNALQVVDSNIEIRTWAPTPTIGTFHAPQSRHQSEDEGGHGDGGGEDEVEMERLRKKAERKLQRSKDRDAAKLPSPSSASPTKSKTREDEEKKATREKTERDQERAARHQRKLERHEEKARAAAVAAAEAAAAASAAAEALRKKMSRHRRNASTASAKQIESNDDEDSDDGEEEKEASVDRRSKDKKTHKRSKSLPRRIDSLDSDVSDDDSAEDVEEDDHTRRKKAAAIAAAVQASVEHRSRKKKLESRPGSENEDDVDVGEKEQQPAKRPSLVVMSNVSPTEMRPPSRAPSPMPPQAQEKSISIGGFTLTRKRSVKFDRFGNHVVRDNEEDATDGRQVGYDGTPFDGGNGCMTDSKRERIKTYLDTVVTSTLKDPRDKHGVKASSRGLPSNPNLLATRGPPPYSASASFASGMDMKTAMQNSSLHAVRKLIVQPAPAPYSNTLFFLDMSSIGSDGSPFVAFRLQGGQTAEQEAAQHKKHGAASRPWLLDSHENGNKVKGQMLFGVEREGPVIFTIDVKRRNVDKFVIQGTSSSGNEALSTFSDALHWGDHDDYRHVYCCTPDGRSLKWYMQEPGKMMRLYGRSDADHGHVYAEARMTVGVPSKKKKKEISREATLLFYPQPQDGEGETDDQQQAAAATLAYLCASWWCARQTYDESRVAAAHAEVEMIEMVEKAFEVDLLAGA